MTVFTLCSVKGSPGVTTTAAAVATSAAVAGRRVLLVELDPSGGSVRMRSGVPPSDPNLADAGAVLRQVGSGASGDEVPTIEVLAGVEGLTAPAGRRAAGVVASLAESWAARLARLEATTVIIDAGRWDPGQASAARLFGAHVVGVVTRPTTESVEQTRDMVDSIMEAARCPVASVVVGDRPYAPDEVAPAIGLPLAGAVDWDPRGVATMWAKGATKLSRRTALVRSSTRVLTGLEAHIPPRHAMPTRQPVTEIRSRA